MENLIKIVPFNERGKLENVINSKVYNIAMKLNNGLKLDRIEKNFITANVNSNTYFKNSIPLMGMQFDFRAVLKTFIVKQYGTIHEYKAIDKTSLRTHIYGSIEYIKELN